MIFDQSIEGKYIKLRAVEEDDAESILKMRCDENMNRFVHPVKNDLKLEIDWIRKQQMRENDYFFGIINLADGEFLGNISIYNIDEHEKSAELGRWLSYGTSISNVESVILAHDFAFDILDLNLVYTKTLQDNSKVVAFWDRFGGTVEANKIIDGTRYFYNEITKENYDENIRPKFIRLLEA